ncbi:hypothetical protein [Alkalilimnicola sp. S0819]|uniref:hypothetical protein n=1 Tax=Alkalilimnicola sp. S0819 TaxID=2613922 RepID=UPI0012626B87|nr:hypothetical protein [Alkalilimnicola sp. S0819]KAB7623684.1 hypothetical protein F3N43_09205 [Alkalilimnicola sp. S0819]MPQ16812.1 hypothetical protein [Alkalilimnicola sp. S0819]
MFHRLRKHRRLVSLALMVTLALWLSTVFAGCLRPAAPAAVADATPAAAAMEHHAHTAMPAMVVCPGGECPSMSGGNGPTLDQDALISSEPTSPLPAAVPALVLFLASAPWRLKPALSDTPRPGRSPILRFYALRI